MHCYLILHHTDNFQGAVISLMFHWLQSSYCVLCQSLTFYSSLLHCNVLVMYFVLRGKFIVIYTYIWTRPFTLGRTIFLISPELHSTQLYIFNGSDLRINRCMYTLEIFVVGVMAFFLMISGKEMLYGTQANKRSSILIFLTWLCCIVSDVHVLHCASVALFGMIS